MKKQIFPNVLHKYSDSEPKIFFHSRKDIIFVAYIFVCFKIINLNFLT